LSLTFGRQAGSALNLLYPKLRRDELPLMLALAATGAIVAGVYGALHDQITYSISEEYFTRVKFGQFHYADFGFPPRVFVAEIGFLASWWAGFFGCWFLARVAVPRHPARRATRFTLQGGVILLLGSLAGGLLAWALAAARGPSAIHADWKSVAAEFQIEQLDRFVMAAYIHNGSYLGCLLGLVAAVIYVKRKPANVCPARD
jgi:hypothetical protein